MLTSSPYKRTLERCKDKGKEKIQNENNCPRPQMQMQMMGTPVGFASCVATAVKRTRFSVCSAAA
jgi:hypothetical protein